MLNVFRQVVVESGMLSTKHEKEKEASEKKTSRHMHLHCVFVCVSAAVHSVNLRVDRSGKTPETARRVVLLFSALALRAAATHTQTHRS